MDDDLKALYKKYQFGGFISFADNMQNTIDILNLSKDLQAAVTPDGYMVDENGAWVVDGKVVTNVRFF